MKMRLHLAAGTVVMVCLMLVALKSSRSLVFAASEEGANSYASPIESLYSPDGLRLYVLCQQSGQVRVLDATTQAEIGRVSVGRVPRGMALSQSGDKIYVTNSWDDTISVIDTHDLKVVNTWSVGMEPSSVVVDRPGRHLFVAARISNDVVVLNAQTGAEEKRLPAGRGASYLTLAPDGLHVYVSHIYPDQNLGAPRTGVENRTAPESFLTVIDVQKLTISERLPLHGIAGLFHIALSADGNLGVAAAMYPKNLVPLAHLEHGGAFADVIALFGKDVGEPVLLPLDELERYASQPFGVAIAPDKSRIYVSCGGSESIVVIDVHRLLDYVHQHPGSHVDNLAASANYVIARIPVGLNPRGIVLSNDGRRLVVANRLDDSLSVIDAQAEKILFTVLLDGPKNLTASRRGEQVFYTARYSFQGQISCSSCHIDSTFDGLTWDLEPDGFGRDIVDNRILEDVKGTEPYKWNGANPSLSVECGPRTEKYFWRSENYDEKTLTDLAIYIRNLLPRPNRYLSKDGKLNAAQERGRILFERSVDKLGNPIEEENRCVHCHSGAKGTDQRSFDVGTTKITDNVGPLDTPQLTNIALTAPYLHDGSARTLEEIWTIYNPNDEHGRTGDLNKEDLRDLIEYLKTR